MRESAPPGPMQNQGVALPSAYFMYGPSCETCSVWLPLPSMITAWPEPMVHVDEAEARAGAAAIVAPATAAPSTRRRRESCMGSSFLGWGAGSYGRDFALP